ncbi:cytochrome P450 [Phyllosticta capitalensis]
MTQPAAALPPPSIIPPLLNPFRHPPPLSLVLASTAALCFLYAAALVTYRLFFSPLRRFPGSKIAAATGWLEFWDDVVGQGRGVWRIEAWHRMYGHIIRISPHELHISDASFHSTLYVSGATRRTDKWAWHAKQFGTTSTTVGAVEHDVHRTRRAPLARFFAARNFAAGGELERVVSSGVARLGECLADKARRRDGEVVNLSAALAACSADVVGACALGRGFGLLEQEDLGENWWRLMLDLSRNTHLMKQFGFIYTLFTHLPQRLVALVHPLTKQLFDVQNSIAARIQTTQAALDKGEKEQAKEEAKSHINTTTTPTPPTLLSHILTSHASLHASPRALTDELFTLLGAGTLSTSHALSVLFYHVLAHPPHLRRLRAELAPLYHRSSNPNSESSSPSPAALQALPFLSACLAEALRLSHGVAGRLPRAAPVDDLGGRRWVIPRGTPVSMTHMFIHLSDAIFASPHAFWPERPRNTTQQHHHWTPFGRGSRACVGRELAMAVMAGVVGEVVGRLHEREGVGMELFETGRDEVEVGRDWFGGVPEKGMRSKGVRVRVVRRGT